MPGETPKSNPHLPSPVSRPHVPEAPPAPTQPSASIASIEADLERARAEYAALSPEIGKLLDDLQRRITEGWDTAPPDLQPNYALLQASLSTLKGRLLSRSDDRAARQIFQKAVELFEKYKVQTAESKSRTRLWTDLGISLHRIGRNDEAINWLSTVCQDGVAPAEAFGYLGYAKFVSGDLEGAARHLRQGLEIAPADLTMSYYLGRVLEVAAQKIAKTEPEKAAAAKAEAAEAYCRAGDIAWNRGEYRSSARDGLRALRLEPGSMRALYLAVNSFHLLKHYKFALNTVESFLKHAPNQPDALGMKGILLRDLGDVTESVRVLKSIPVGSPDLAWVRAQLAWSLSEANSANLDEALNAASEAVGLAPNDPSARIVLGLLQVRSEDYESAVLALTRARELGDSSEYVALDLAWALTSLGRYHEAGSIAEEVVAANPRSAVAYNVLAICAESSGNVGEALAHYRKASRLAPDDSNVFVKLMSLLNAEGLRSQALEEIETRLSGPVAYLALWYKAKFQIQDEDWTNSLANLRRVFAMAKEGNDRRNLPGILIDCGDVLRRIGDFKIAKISYDYAYKMDPMRQDVVLGKAICDCEIADFDGARASLEKVLDPTSDDASFAYLWNLHGWSLQHLGDAAGAMKSYRKAFELDGQEDPWYRKGLANMMLNFDPEAAKENFKVILNELSYSMESRPPREQPSGDTSTERLMGWCNYRLGHYVEAFRLIESVVDRFPDPHSARFDLGLFYLASGRLRLAKEAYVRGYELARRCQVLQRRGIFYIALFDLADGRKYGVLGPDSNDIFATMTKWLASSGVPLDKLAWFNPSQPQAAH